MTKAKTKTDKKEEMTKTEILEKELAAERAIEDNKMLAEDYLHEGLEKFVARDWDGAVEAYGNALKRNPEWAESYAKNGTVKTQRGEGFMGAISGVKTIELKTQHAQAYTNRGLDKMLHGELSNAIKDFDKATELDPHFTSAKKLKREAEAEKRKKVKS